MSKPPKSLKHALRAAAQWTARGSNCPICHRPFRSNACPHSVGAARAVLQSRVNTAARKTVGRALARALPRFLEGQREQAKLNLKKAVKHEFDLRYAGPVPRPSAPDFDLLVELLAENPQRFAELLTAYAALNGFLR